MFSGAPPRVTDWLSLVNALLIVIPAMLIAFAIDVGQISTSSEIRNGNRTLAKKITFAVLAVTTYYLQWLYLAHHLPSLSLGNGIRTEWIFLVTIVRDASIWVLPALLPMATILYTSSHTVADRRQHEIVTQRPEKRDETPVSIPKPEPALVLSSITDAEGKALKPAKESAGLTPVMGATSSKLPYQNGNGHSNGNGTRK